MNAYAKYSNFMENSLGLGRNGKRLAHGAAVGGGVWAAGHYGGVEVINNNMPVAVGGGVVGGILATVAADAMWIDAEAEAEMLRLRFEGAGKEVHARLLPFAAALFAQEEPQEQQQPPATQRAPKRPAAAS